MAVRLLGRRIKILLQQVFSDPRCHHVLWLRLRALIASRTATKQEISMSHDEKLQKFVLAQLHWEPSVDAAHLGVAAYDGVVTLTGHVENFAGKMAASASARSVKGVKAVVDEIEVRLDYGRQRDDAIIAAAAVDRLAWDVLLPRDAIKVKVEKAHLSLFGEVDWHYQKKAAEQDMRRLIGILSVSNHITIRSRVDVANISEEITDAMHRCWFSDPKKIEVSAEFGRVTLTGSVHSVHDRQLAAVTAWSAAGVTDVTNDIVVK